MVFKVPSRGLLGFRTDLTNETRGTALMKQSFLGYEEYAGDLKKNPQGAIVSTAEGKSSAYALKDVETHGQLFIEPGVSVYEGMVIGENSIERELNMNPAKTKGFSALND